MDDEKEIRALLQKMASDSMRRKETPEQWADRLRALKEPIDEEIAAVRS